MFLWPGECKSVKNENEVNSDKFISLLIPNQKRILGYILTHVPNYSDADDILQNTLSILWRKFDKFDPDTDFVAYANAIAKYEIMNFYRKKENAQKMHFDEKLHEIIEAETDSISNLFHQRKDAFQQCYKEISPKDKQLIKMRYEQDLPFSKMAKRLCISSPAVLKKIANIHGRIIRCIRLRMAFESTI